MLYLNKFSLILFITMISGSTFTQEIDKPLPVLKTKQSLNNIRFISSDGKLTYFQRRSGDLQLSKNYLNYEVLKRDKFTEYFISASDTKKKMLIEIDSSFHTEMNHLKKNEIYIMDYGSSEPQKVTEGAFPKLQFKDRFFSYFDTKKKSLHYVETNDLKTVFTIKLNNKLNPYYVPETDMITNYDIVYTDINSSGQNAILMYSALDKKSKVIYKSTLSGGRLDYCIMDKKIYIGEFSFGDIPNASKIVEVPIYNNEGFKNYKVIYQSQQSDIGNLNCSEDKIYFIKTLSYNKKLNLKQTEIAAYNIKTANTDILTNLKYVTQIIKIDDMIVAPFRGEYYLIKGNPTLTQDGIEKDKAVDERDLNLE
tara:strand:- start:32663 stop:33760 length:1098 start_codon:yes stop_codon:yes gene_type:complete